MNITQEKSGDLTTLVKVEVSQADYLETVNNVLKDYQKKANMPGFRPGKVPFGMVKKMYGQAVLAEEVNKILTDSLNKYLLDHEIKILGHPMPNTEKSPKQDFEMGKDFDFYFDVGLAPEIELEIDDKLKVDYVEIEPDDSFIDKYVDDVRKRSGETENPESSEGGDLLHGEILQLNEEGTLVEEGLHHHTTIAIEMIKDKKQQNKFMAVKKGDIFNFNPLEATGNETETAHMLGINVDELEQYGDHYQFTVEEVIRMKPAKLSKELFLKVFPNDQLETEEDFRERIAGEARVNFVKESDNLFMNDVIEKMIEEAKIDLPDEFLKRWLLESNEGKVTAEQIEEEFQQYAKALKWQLIQNKVVTEHNIEIKDEDIRNYVKDYLQHQLHIYNDGEEAENRLDSIIDSVMQNKEEVGKIYDQLLDQKLKEVLKTTVKLKNKKLNYDEFIKLVNKKNK